MNAVVQSTARRLAKRITIQSGLEAIALSGAAHLAPSAAGRGVVFTLHHVRPERGFGYEPNSHLAITPRFLDDAITTARECGLHPVQLEELPNLLADPRDERRFVCFTLDDGYRNNAQFAAPVFAGHRVPYTIFITPGFVERTRTMWWETAEQITRAAQRFAFDFGTGAETVVCKTQAEKFAAFERLARFVERIDEDEAVERIDTAARSLGIDPVEIVEGEVMTAHELRELAADPLVRFGAHTMTHPNLARISAQRVREELAASAARVAEYAGRPITTVSFPYGGRLAAGERESAIARELGFAVAVTTQPGVLGSADPSTLTFLPRVSLNGNYQKTRYVRALASGLPFKLMPGGR